MAQALARLDVEQRRLCAARETVIMRQRRPQLIPTACLKGSTKIVHMRIALLCPHWTFFVRVEHLGIVHRSLRRERNNVLRSLGKPCYLVT